MTGIDHLLLLARTYATAENISLSAVSWRVFGDTKKLPAMEAGADIQLRRFEKSLLWFSKNWPEGVAWPDGVVRPDVEIPLAPLTDGASPEDGADAASLVPSSLPAVEPVS